MWEGEEQKVTGRRRKKEEGEGVNAGLKSGKSETVCDILKIMSSRSVWDTSIMFGLERCSFCR